MNFSIVFILLIPRTTLSPFLQNLIGRSGNSPWIEICEKSFSQDSVAETLHFHVQSITHSIVSNVTSRFSHFRVTWICYRVREKSSYRFLEPFLLNVSRYITCYISFWSIFFADFKNVRFIVIQWTYLILWWFIIFIVKMNILLKKLKIWSLDTLFSSKSSICDITIVLV